MGSAKGVLIIPVGFNPDGDVRAVTLSADDYLHTVLETGLTGGGMGEPKGKLVTWCGFNPDGDIRAVELDANDNLLITLLGGSANQIIKSDGTDAEWADLPALIVSEFAEGARVYHNTPQSIPSGSDTVLSFNTESYDTNELHDPVTNNSRLTCKTAGKYLIQANVLWAHNATSVRLMRIKVNNSISIVVEVRPPVTAAGWATANFLLMVYALAVNDYVECFVNQGTGSALNILAQGISTPAFSMQRLG